jgi:hypothetical protein
MVLGKTVLMALLRTVSYAIFASKFFQTTYMWWSYIMYIHDETESYLYGNSFYILLLM